MTNTATAIITGETLSRSQLEALLASAQAAFVFKECDFDGADLSRLALRGCGFHSCSFLETLFYSTDLSETAWTGCRGGQAGFESAALVDAQFQACDLNNTQWRRARLSSASFKACKLTGANFEEVASLGLSFEDTLLVGADLRKMSFRKMRLQQLDFSEAELSGCDFREAVFEGGSLRNAHLKLTRFEGADLREADLGGMKLLEARLFKGATVSYNQATDLLAELGLRVA